MKRNLKLEQWQVDGIEKLAAQGKSQRDIARQLDTTPQTVNAHIKKIKNRAREKLKAELAKSNQQPRLMTTRLIDLSTVPTQDSIATDILIAYRATLAELQTRLPDMSVNEIYTLSMSLLREINGHSES